MSDAVRDNNLVTVDFYIDCLHIKMIGSVYLEKKRLMESVELVGKAICRARKLNSVECVIYDSDGNMSDQHIVFRGR